MESTSTHTVVDTGAGNDTVDVSSDGKAGLGTLGGLLGQLTVDGQGGSDTLNIGDLADLVAGRGQLSSTAFTGFGTAGIGYQGFENVNVQLGQATEALNVVSTYLQAVTTIRAGPGADTINVSSDAPTDLGTLSGIAGHLIVDGQAGHADTLNVSDAGDLVGQTGALSSTDIFGLGTAGVEYHNVATLNITLGSGSDTFNVTSTALGTATTLDTGAGNDVVNVSSNAPTDSGTLSGTAGSLAVNGQSGSDILNVSDAGDATGQAGTLTSTGITGLGTAGIGYSNIEQLNVTLGSGNDTFEHRLHWARTTTVATGTRAMTRWSSAHRPACSAASTTRCRSTAGRPAPTSCT